MDIALDCETGGLDPELNPILGFDLWSPELGEKSLAVRVRGVGFDGTPLLGRFGTPMLTHPRALQANGLDPGEGVSLREAREKLLTWWESLGRPQLHLVGHNVGPFDVPFLKQLTWHGGDLPWQAMFDYHYQDTATLAYALQKAGVLHFGKWSLTNVCQVLGILYDPHLSKADAKAAWHANERMCALLKLYHEEAHAHERTTTLNELIRQEILPALDLRAS